MNNGNKGIIYDEENKVLGRFLENGAGFEINTLNLPAPWEYIYQNGDVLLKMDEKGPVFAQEKPPKGIMLFQRGNGQKFSNWGVWIKKKEHLFTNFYRPLVDGTNPELEPQQYKAVFYPHKAIYSFVQEDLKIETEFIIPECTTEIVMKVHITNLSADKTEVSLYPYLVPYLNMAQLAPWDKYEWYLKSGVGRDEEAIFWSQLLSPSSDRTERRTAILRTDLADLIGTEISYEKFIGQGELYCPQQVTRGSLRITGCPFEKLGSYQEENSIYAYPPIYAAQYRYDLNPMEERVLTQVFSVYENDQDGWLPEREKIKEQRKYFSKEIYDTCVNERKESFDSLFHKNSIATGNQFFDSYINNWLPLQLHWVSALDRGWPSGMRGTRDSAQDYTALLYLYPERCRDMLIQIFSCQRKDGWFPRQYSANGRKGKHDLRGHVDAGAFVIEFIYYYLAFTGDKSILSDTCPWLDSDEDDTILAHSICALSYYLHKSHLGEHGLCKIGEGDWLDSVNRAGVMGRGESVMVSEQVIMCVEYMKEILEDSGDYADLIGIYEQAALKLKENLLKHALNSSGYFNGVFSDSGNWIFSDKDPDGETRIYGPTNWYSIISGVATREIINSVMGVKNKLKCSSGYRLYWPPMGIHPMECVGRAASGDAPVGFAENGNVYNHGSQGFLARALAKVYDGNGLWDTLDYLLPFNQEKHPAYETMLAPYAIVNCWQELPIFHNRGLFGFLTGSVAMAERCVYEWMAGIIPALDGFFIDPCIPDFMDKLEVNITYQNHRVHMIIENPDHVCSNVNQLILNGHRMTGKRRRMFSEKEVYFIEVKELKKEINDIVVTLG